MGVEQKAAPHFIRHHPHPCPSPQGGGRMHTPVEGPQPTEPSRLIEISF
jgi:hypothetical protein